MAKILDLTSDEIATANQESNFQVVSQTTPDATPVVEEELGFIDGVYSTFMQENTLGSAARYGFTPSGTNSVNYTIDPDSTFNQYKHWLDNRDEFADLEQYVKNGALEGVVTEEMFKDRVERLRMEVKHREHAARAGLGGMLVGGLTGGLLDPTILLPVVGQAKLVGTIGKVGYKLERALNNKVVRGIATGGYMSAVQEAELHVFQELRTAEESAWATGFGTVIGGGAGLFASAASPSSFLHPQNPNYVFRPESKISMGVKGVGDAMSESRVIQKGKVLFEEVADIHVGGRSVGAMAVDNPVVNLVKAGSVKGATLAQTGVKAVGKAGLAVTNVINRMTPIGAGMQSPSSAMRMITAKLYDSGGVLNDANIKGQTIISVEDRAAQMQTFFDQGVLIGARALYMDLQTKLAELAGKETSDLKISAGEVGADMKSLYQDVMAGPSGSGKPRNMNFEGRTGNLQRHEFEDITTYIAHEDMSDDILKNLEDRFGKEGADAIVSSATKMADTIHNFNKIMEDELVRVGMLADSQRLGKKYVAPQKWLGKSIRADKAGAKSFFLEVFAGKPSDDFLLELGLDEASFNKLGVEDVTVKSGDESKTYTVEEGKAYRLEVLEEWTGDKYYTELGELERKIDGLTTAEKDSRQRAVLAARDLRTTITDIKNASVDEAVAIHQKKTAERDASVAEREKLGLENQKAKEELRSAEEEFKARANQQHNTKGPLKKLNEERKGTVKEAEGIMNLANKDPDSTPADFEFARDNLTAADNELYNAPQDALDQMILDAAGKPISTPRLTMYRDRVRKLDARINRINKKLALLEPKLAKLGEAANEAVLIRQDLTASKKAKRKLMKDTAKDASAAQKAMKAGKKALRKKGTAPTLITYVDELVDKLSARNGSAAPIGMGNIDEMVLESGRSKLRAIKLSNDQRRMAQELGFLDANTFGSLHNGVQELSRRIAFKDTFGHYGTDENAMIAGMKKEVEEEFDVLIAKAKAEGAGTLKLMRLRDKKQRHMTYVEKGSLRQLGLLDLPKDPEDVLTYSVGKAREWNFVRYGSGFLVSSLTDLSNVVLTSGFGTFSRQNLKALDATLKGLSNAEIQRTAMALELLMHNSRNMKVNSTEDLGNMLGIGELGSMKHYVTSNWDRVSAGLAQTTSTMSGMLWWNTRLKMLAMIEMQHNFVNMAGKYDGLLAAASAGDKAAENQIAQLASLGLGADQMRGVKAMLKKHPPEFTAHTPGDSEGVMELAMDRWLKEGDVGQRAYQDVLNALQRSANRAVMTPGKGDTPFLMSGQMGKTILQFQTYGFAIMNRYMTPAFQRMASYGDMEAFMSLGVATAMGSAVVSIKDILNNGEIKERSLSKWAYDVTDRSGLMAWLSPYFAQGQKIMGVENSSRYSNERDRIALVFGPTGGLAQDVWDFGSAATEGDSERAWKTAKKLAPFNMLGKLYNIAVPDGQ